MMIITWKICFKEKSARRKSLPLAVNSLAGNKMKI